MSDILSGQDIIDNYTQELQPSGPVLQSFLNEIVAWETFRMKERQEQKPATNLAEYRGCIVKQGCVVALAFTRYRQNLVERVYHDRRPFSTELTMYRIGDGLAYIHGEGWANNEITPLNIMFGANTDIPRIVNFGSCNLEGQQHLMRGGPTMWNDDPNFDREYARFKNDAIGVARIRHWLENLEAYNWYTPRDRDRHRIQGHHGQLDLQGKTCFICK